jgi:hypothetical protein
MKKANSDYEQRNYDDAISLLVPAIAHCPLTEEEKIQANKLLILCYLSVDNLEAANNVAAAIMKENPNYKPDKLKDDPRLFALFEKYKPTPVFSVGVFGGINIPSIRVTNTYSVVHSDNAPGLATYSNKTSFQFGAKAEYRAYRGFWVSGGILYRQSSYEHDLDSISNEQVKYIEKLDYLDFPFSGKYYFLKKNFQPYLEAGVDLSFLVSANSTIFRGAEQDASSVTTLRNTFQAGYFGAIGYNYKHNGLLLFIDIRYIYFPGQVNKIDTRYTDNINLWKYYYIDNDFTMNNMQLNIGAAYIMKYRNLNHSGK